MTFDQFMEAMRPALKPVVLELDELAARERRVTARRRAKGLAPPFARVEARVVKAEADLAAAGTNVVPRDRSDWVAELLRLLAIERQLEEMLDRALQGQKAGGE